MLAKYIVKRPYAKAPCCNDVVLVVVQGPTNLALSLAHGGARACTIQWQKERDAGIPLKLRLLIAKQSSNKGTEVAA